MTIQWRKQHATVEMAYVRPDSGIHARHTLELFTTWLWERLSFLERSDTGYADTSERVRYRVRRASPYTIVTPHRWSMDCGTVKTRRLTRRRSTDLVSFRLLPASPDRRHSNNLHRRKNWPNFPSSVTRQKCCQSTMTDAERREQFLTGDCVLLSTR
jgi:hypothetical protein